MGRPGDAGPGYHRPESVIERTGEIHTRPSTPDGDPFPDRRPVAYGPVLLAAAALIALVALTGGAAYWLATLGGPVWHG